MSKYYLVPTSELYHHGVKGMKWGVRRYQNPDGSLTPEGRKRQSRQYQKELNSLDKSAAESIATYIRYKHDSDKKIAKTTQFMNKHDGNPTLKDTKKLEKLSKSAIDAATKTKMAKNLVDSIESATWKKLAKINEEGYNVDSHNVIRRTKQGEVLTTGLLSGIYGTALMSTIVKFKYSGEHVTTDDYGLRVDQTPYYVLGKKYKVRAGQNGRTSYTNL